MTDQTNEHDRHIGQHCVQHAPCPVVVVPQ